MPTALFALLLSSACTTTVTLTDEHNFTYVGDMTIDSIETASGSDLEICWDDLVKDLRCHDMSPTQDIELLSLIRFPNLSQDEVEAGISTDSLTQAMLDGYVSLETGGESCGTLSDFNFFGTPIDVPSEYVESGGTYLLMLSTGLEPGQGARMLSFLAPSESSDVTDVAIGDGCDLLDFSADLESLTPVSLPTDGPWLLDWSALTRTGLSQSLNLANIDGLTVGFYEGYSVVELQEAFLDLELIDSTTWAMDLPSGSTAELGEAVNESGQTLEALDGDGVYLLGLFCSTCSNPAPLFLTILEPA